MEKKYYAVINRDSFIKLFKYGRVTSFKTSMLEITENDMERKMEKILKEIDFLSGEEEDVIILKIDNKNTQLSIKEGYEINIENVQNYYLLSNKAQQFYVSKINSKINFEVLPYKNILNELEEKKEIEDMERGAEILLKQYGFKSEKMLNKEFEKKLRCFLKLETYLENDFENFYYDLLSYRRKNKFQKEDVSYIYDLIIIAILKDRKQELVDKFQQAKFPINTSSSYELLENNKKYSLLEYIEFLNGSKNKNIEKFIDKIGVKKLIVGILFLKIREMKEEENLEEIKKTVDFFYDKYKEELRKALYLIGLVFGYEKLRHEYYEFIGCYGSNNKTKGEIPKSFKCEAPKTSEIDMDYVGNQELPLEIEKKDGEKKNNSEKKEKGQIKLLEIKNNEVYGENEEKIQDKIIKLMKDKNIDLIEKENKKSVSLINKKLVIVVIEELSKGKVKLKISLKNINGSLIDENKKIVDKNIEQIDKNKIKTKYDKQTKKYILTLNGKSKTMENIICNVFKELII